MKILVKPGFVKTITFGFAAAITLWPFGIFLLKDKYLNNAILINHEAIHWKQSQELLGIFFYIFYVLEWFVKLFFYGKNAYYNISFEREANYYENNLEYTKTRKHFKWIKFIFKKC
jgi:NADH:ubiquinone oxidoreductase subunit 5 (subunit L)/multisubunit Na+/H+ antiporter MnhA subunit